MTTETSQTLREKARDAVAQALGDSYDCERVWSAWNEGTMSENDFSCIADDSDRVYEIVDVVLNEIGFDDLVEKANALQQEIKALRKSITDAADNIRFHVAMLEDAAK